MRLSVIFRGQADRDMAEAAQYLSADDLQVGIRFLHAVQKQAELLAEFPNLGTLRLRVPQHLKGVRFIPLTKFRSYLLFYLVVDARLEVVRVLHGARHLGRTLRQTN